MPAPNTAVSIMASSRAGKANVKSARRMMASSTQPLRAAASSPSAVPTPMPMPTAITPTRMELRAPTMRSERMSRPNASVPSQWAVEGGCNLAAKSTS